VRTQAGHVACDGGASPVYGGGLGDRRPARRLGVVHARHLTLMRVFMPLRGRATARNFPKFLDGLRSHIRSCSLEGPRLSRDQPPRGADGWRCFSAVGPSVVGIQWRALPAWPQPGADRTWLHHTLMETRSPSRWRVQRTSRRIRCGLDTSLGPPTVLGNKAAAQVSCAR